MRRLNNLQSTDRTSAAHGQPPCALHRSLDANRQSWSGRLQLRPVLALVVLLLGGGWTSVTAADPVASSAVDERPATETPGTSKVQPTTPVPESLAPKRSDSTTPQSAEVATWIQNLNSDDYAERQNATKNLRRSGTVGVAALAVAAQGANLETTARAIELLTQLYESPDPDVALAADEALEAIGEHGPPVAAVRTHQALSTTLAPIRRRHAIAAVKRMGGNIIPFSNFDDESEKEIEADLNDEGTIQNVVLGRKWTGGLKGIKYLQRLPELRNMIITKDIALTAEEQDQLRAKLPNVRVDVRGSAYLGIKSGPTNQLQDICNVDTVVPKSPADMGGMKSGDIITHLDGLPVTNFPSLTTSLSVKRGGDIVYLEIQRGDDYLELEVTLGEW